MEFLVNTFLWLMAYSFIGWVYESALCSLTQKELINRGFLNGPICPVYGVGALIIIFSLSDVSNNILVLFLSSAVLTTVLEYVTSYLLEKLFHAKWWDYSKYRFNVNGRVCLLGAVVFGMLSVLLIEFIHPFLLRILSRFSFAVRASTAAVLFCILIADLFVTIRHILLLNGRLEVIQNAINNYKDDLRQRTEALRENLSEKFEGSRFHTKKIQTLINLKKFQDRRLLRAFPKMKSTRYADAFEKLRERINLPRNTHAK